MTRIREEEEWAVQFISIKSRVTLSLSEKFYECHTPQIKLTENSLPISLV